MRALSETKMIVCNFHLLVTRAADSVGIQRPGGLTPRWNGFEITESQAEEAGRAIEIQSSILSLKSVIEANSIGKTTQFSQVPIGVFTHTAFGTNELGAIQPTVSKWHEQEMHGS